MIVTFERILQEFYWRNPQGQVKTDNNLYHIKYFPYGRTYTYKANSPTSLAIKLGYTELLK